MSQRLPIRRSLSLAVAAALCAALPVAAQDAAPQSPAAPAAAPSGDDAKELDAVIVTGIRAALLNARELERERDVISNIVSADDVGQFADQSAAESLQRVPGISVDRDAGEARRLSIRGLGPLFNPVRLNGMLIGSSDLDRDAVVDLLPNDLLGTLEVTKTLTPDMDGDAVGGAVDLKSIDPFERDPGGLVRVEAGRQQYSGEVTPRVSGVYTTDWEDAGGGRWGVSLAGSYSARDLEGDVLRNRDTPTYSRVGFPDRSTPTEGWVLRSVRAEQRFDQSERTRLGVSANLYWAPNEAHEFYLRTVGSRLDREDVQYTNRYQIPANPSTPTATNQVVLALGPRTGMFRNAELRKQANFLERSEDTWMAQLGGRSALDTWTFNYWMGASGNELDVPQQLTGRFRVRGITVDLAQTEDSIVATPRPGTAATSDPGNLANYLYDNLTLVTEARTDDILSAQFDAGRELDIANLPGEIKLGVEVSQRDKKVDRQETSGNPAGLPGLPATNLAGLPTFAPNTRIPGYGLMPVAGPTLGLFRASLAALQPNAVNSAAEDFAVGEDVAAGYAMGTVRLSDTLSLITGVRVERTRWTTSGNELETVDSLVGADRLSVRALAPVRNEYDNVLPSVHLRWEPRSDLVVRAAWTNAVIRPNFDEGSATRSVTSREQISAPGTFFRTYSGGNPLLDPLSANQFDLSVGWYPTESSFLYAGLFHKTIDNFFVDGQFIGPAVTRVGLPVGNGTLTGGFDLANVVLNGDEATVQGVELAFEKAFVELPGWLSGVFVSGNVTLLDSEASVPLLRPGESVVLPDQADRIANLSLGWENERVSVRVAGNYRGEQLDVLASNAQLDQVLQAWTSVDFNLRWNVFDGVQVYFDGTNLNDRKDVTVFRGDAAGGFPADEAVNDFGRTYAVGLVYKF